MYVQSVSVYAGTMRSCVSACAQDERQEKTRRKTKEEKRRDKMKENRREIRLWLSVFLFKITRPSNNFEFSKLPLPTLQALIIFPEIFVREIAN